MPSLELPKVRKNQFIEIIPISGGCLGNCSYCKTKHARGSLNSYSEDAIVSRALQAVEDRVPGCHRLYTLVKHTKNYGISPFLMGKSTISMAIFHSYFDISRG